MTAKTISEGILRAIAILVGIALVLFFLYKIQSVLAYLTIAVIASLLGRPIVLLLRIKLRFNNTLAVIVTMVLLIGGYCRYYCSIYSLIGFARAESFAP